MPFQPMPFQQSGNVRYFTFEHLSRAGVVHGILTRQGGVSGDHFRSLNVGRMVGDHPQHVEENHQLGMQALGRTLTGMAETRQVHGVDIVSVEQSPARGGERPQADGLVTDRAGITLFMRFADCVPILLFDPQKKVVGMAHAGWRGTVGRIAKNAVREMQTRYGVNPRDILAGIGPSICREHYPIGEEVVVQIKLAFGEATCQLLHRENGTVHLDLWAANHLVLVEAGVKQIEIAGQCTAADLEHWYSHRAEQGQTGRFGALIGI